MMFSRKANNLVLLWLAAVAACGQTEPAENHGPEELEQAVDNAQLEGNLARDLKVQN